MIHDFAFFIIDIIAAIIWIIILQRFDHHREDKNKPKILIIFFFGGCLSVIPAIFLSKAGITFWEPLATGAYVPDSFLEHFLITGPAEEFSKFAVFALISIKLKSIQEPVDGMLQAACTALGFAAVENFIYASSYGYGNLLFRSFFSAGGHIVYAMLWGFFFGYFTYLGFRTDHGKRPWKLFMTALIPAAFFHGFFNFLVLTSPEITGYIVDAAALAAVIVLFKLTRRQSPYRKFSFKDYKEALHAISLGLKHHPDSFHLHKQISLYYIYGGFYKDAYEHLFFCRKKKPKDVVVKLLIGIISILLEDTQGGRIYLEEYLSGATAKQKALLQDKVKILIPRSEDRIQVLSELHLCLS